MKNETKGVSTEQLDGMIRKAATAALSEWYSDQWDLQADSLDDLAQELWVWYLERPGTRAQIEEADEFLARRLIFNAALQILSKQSLSEDVFDGRNLYSSESVREALKGDSTNKYLNQIMPFAVNNLDRRNPGQAEAVRARYDDEEVPERGGAAEKVLMRAVKSLTEEVNVIYLTSNDEGVGSSAAVFPDTRKRKGERSDPTGDTVVMLDEHPEFSHHYLEETPISHTVAGAQATPAYSLGGGIRYRPVGFQAEAIRKMPGLVEPFLAKEKSRMGLEC